MADGDADQQKGENDAGTPPETGADDSDAGNDTGDGLSFQEIYNRGAKETREALQGKLDEQTETIDGLRTRLDELEGSGEDSDEREAEFEEQLERVKAKADERVEAATSQVEAAQQALAKSHLLNAMQGKVIDPEYHAERLMDRLDVDLEAGIGPDAVTVLTEGGNKAIGDDGEALGLEGLVDRFLSERPHFAKDRTRSGAGFEGSGEGGGTPDIDTRIRRAERKGDFETAGRLKDLKLADKA